MTTTATSQAAATAPRYLTPEEIGWLVKTFRSAHGWTQETLAELSGLQTRTIQRVEQGQPSSIDTRRALARAFGMDEMDYFSTLKSFPMDEEAQKRKEEFDRDFVLLDARVVDGRQLLSIIQDAPGLGAISPGSIGALPRAAQDAFARIVDYVQDCLDIFDVASRAEILGYGDDIDGHIADLGVAGFCLCAAFRRVNLVSRNDEKPTPMPCQVAYLLASPKDQPATKVAVVRRVSF